MTKKKTPSKKAGRPKVDERKQSFTVSIKPSDKEWIDGEYGSLTASVEKEVLSKKPKNKKK